MSIFFLKKIIIIKESVVSQMSLLVRPVWGLKL